MDCGRVQIVGIPVRRAYVCLLLALAVARVVGILSVSRETLHLHGGLATPMRQDESA